MHFYRGKLMFLHLSVSHSVHGGSVSQHALGQTPHPWQTYPSMQWGRHPLGQTYPSCTRADTPSRHPPWQTYPSMHRGRHPPEGRHSPGQMATAADGTHPTGMHSCYCIILLFILFFCAFFSDSLS